MLANGFGLGNNLLALGISTGVGAHPPKPPPLVEPERNPPGLRFFFAKIWINGALNSFAKSVRDRPLLRCKISVSTALSETERASPRIGQVKVAAVQARRARYRRGRRARGGSRSSSELRRKALIDSAILARLVCAGSIYAILQLIQRVVTVAVGNARRTLSRLGILPVSRGNMGQGQALAAPSK